MATPPSNHSPVPASAGQLIAALRARFPQEATPRIDIRADLLLTHIEAWAAGGITLDLDAAHWEAEAFYEEACFGDRDNTETAWTDFTSAVSSLCADLCTAVQAEREAQQVAEDAAADARCPGCGELRRQVRQMAERSGTTARPRRFM